MDVYTVEYLLETKNNVVVYKRESVRQKRELIYRKENCVGCWLCFSSCPKEAISRNPIGIIDGKAVDHPGIVIDPEKCVLCGICAEVCMFSGLELLINGENIRKIPGYPVFRHVYEINEKCKPKDEKALVVCRDCENVCPRDALKCSLLVEPAGKVKNAVERNADKCIYCTTCKLACPEHAINVEKVFEGEISVDLEKCQGCGVCVEICPAKSLTMPKPKISEKVDRLVVNKDTCVYCAACANACPVEALTVKRKELKFKTEKRNSATKRREKILQELIMK